MNSAEVVLFRPQIPQNTGNIGRLCVNTNTKLHLIKPLGYSLDEKYLKRAGMDYWKHVNLCVHDDWNKFLESANNTDNLYFFSTKTDKLFWDSEYGNNSEDSSAKYLIFGSETSGLTEEMYRDYKKQLYTIPMYGDHCRSYNLSNSVAIVLFDYLRKAKFCS